MSLVVVQTGNLCVLQKIKKKNSLKKAKIGPKQWCWLVAFLPAQGFEMGVNLTGKKSKRTILGGKTAEARDFQTGRPWTFMFSPWRQNSSSARPRDGSFLRSSVGKEV